MKKFIYNLLLFFSMAILIPGITAFILPSNEANYMKAYGIKQNRLDKIENNRILLIGFSELAFGIDSKMMEDSLHKNVINCGLHAGLGFEFIINDALKNSRPGDMVVIFPSLFDKKHRYGGSNCLPFLVDLYPSVWKDLSFKNKLVVIKGLYNNLLYGKLNYWGYKVIGRATNDVSNFNNYGDEYAHRLKHYHQDIQVRTFFPSQIDYNYLHSWIQIIKSIENKGCKVFIMPTILQDKSYECSKDAITCLVKEFKETGYPYIIPPEEVVVSDFYLYDNASHANDKGVIFFTNKLIEALKAKIY